MEYNYLFNIIQFLPFEEKVTIFVEGEVEIFVIRPRKAFKTYDINKNFQIFIKEGDREFRPNHLRVMIDLHLRVRSRPDLKNELLIAFDKIYYRQNSLKSITCLKDINFDHYLNSISIIAVLNQLFILEQDYNYEKESKYDPPTLFYQGWVRQSLDSIKEIDNLVMSICRFQPPAAKYTFKENRKHKKFDPNLNELWYL